jgi:hypothetical protein
MNQYGWRPGHGRQYLGQGTSNWMVVTAEVPADYPPGIDHGLLARRLSRLFERV